MQEIFAFRRVGTDADGRISGEFRCTGIRPKFTQEFATRGITVDDGLFSPDRLLG